MGRSNRKGKTSSQLIKTIADLQKVSRDNGAPVWRTVADRLEGPARNLAEVNLDEASKHLKEGEVGVVPGRVLGNGRVRRGLVLAAYGFTKSAREKLVAAGGNALSLEELFNSNPHGKKLRILG